jgi:hypothetical protein
MSTPLTTFPSSARAKLLSRAQRRVLAVVTFLKAR